MGLAVATTLLGVALLIIGKLKLASLVSYLPAPVVGGYLAFIGYFCLLSGLNLCTGLIFNANFNDMHNFVTLVTTSKLVILTLPGLFGGALLLLVATKCTNVGKTKNEDKTRTNNTKKIKEMISIFSSLTAFIFCVLLNFFFLSSLSLQNQQLRCH